MLQLFLYSLLLPPARTGEIGDGCVGRDGWEGVCTLSYDCRSLGGLIPRGFTPELCNTTDPVICCPDLLLAQEQPTLSRHYTVKRVAYIRPHAHLYLKVTRPVDNEVEVVREVVRRRRKPVIRLKPVGVRRRKRRPRPGNRLPPPPLHHHAKQKQRPAYIAASTLNYIFNQAPTTPSPKTGVEALAEESMDYQAVFTRTSPPKKRIPKRVSQIKCEDYGNIATETVAELSKYGVVPVKVEKCSLTNANYESGVSAAIAEFPHVAGIGYDDSGTMIWGCAGSLISENFVLTAAHCTDSVLGRPSRVRLGEVKLGAELGGRRALGVQERGVADVVVHWAYDPSTRDGDLALLRVAKPLRLTDTIRPACLQSSAALISRKAIAADWTSLESLAVEIKLAGNKTHMFSDESEAVGLRKSTLDLVENKKCAIPPDATDAYLCADNTLPCTGDGGGGPLQIRTDTNKCMYSLIGIASSQTCEEKKPAIYTRISHYLTWIEDKVWP